MNIAGKEVYYALIVVGIVIKPIKDVHAKSPLSLSDRLHFAVVLLMTVKQQCVCTF